MNDHGFLLQALVYLAAATIFVPLFRRLGLGSVLGYLVAGIAIGPWGLRLITETQTVRQVSEFGVVLLLFLVGIELNPDRLWSLRRAIFGLGTLQVVVSTLVFAGLGRALGLGWPQAVTLGMAAAMSSTAIALQTLGERGLMTLPSGQASFAVSLFQDLAVIPMLLAVTLLSPDGEASAGFSWMKPALAIALLAAMVLGGRLLLRPLLRWIASTGMREVFIGFALLLIVGSAWLTSSVGLSMGLGSFIAGVLLADSEYRMELEVDIEPFKGLLLGLFFIAVGMSIDIGLLASKPLLILGLALAAVILKALVILVLGWQFRLCREDGWLFALSLSQIGEFAFVIVGQAQGERLLSDSLAGMANAVVAASMLATPLLFLAYDRWVAPRYRQPSGRAPDRIDERNAVIVAGMGRFGQIVARMLLAKQQPVTMIDHDPNQIEVMARFGFRTYYGDARRPDVLEAAGIADARLLILTMDDPKAVREAAEHVLTHYPAVQVIARARGRTDAIALERLGVRSVRETFGSALFAAQRALLALGESPEAVQLASERFRAHDERLFSQQLQVTDGDEDRLIAIAAQGRRDLARLLATEAGDGAGAVAGSAAPAGDSGAGDDSGQSQRAPVA